MARASSSRQPSFVDPSKFTSIDASGKWFCNLCTSPQQARMNCMSGREAEIHEKSDAHKQREEEFAMWNPQPDVDAWVPGASDDLYDERITEKMQHVDDLKKLIPFWLQQVEAAVSDGVELRYEDFLESLACTEERNDCPEWDVPMPDWAMDVNEDERSSVTGRAEQSTGNASERSDEDMRSVSNHSSDVVDRDAFVFVEKIAQMNALDEQRKRKLHAFYKSPTAEKVAAIQGLIHVLKTTA